MVCAKDSFIVELMMFSTLVHAISMVLDWKLLICVLFMDKVVHVFCDSSRARHTADPNLLSDADFRSACAHRTCDGQLSGGLKLKKTSYTSFELKFMSMH